jgi:hypothetical protein
MALLSPPTTICRSWHPTEDPDLEGDDEELAVDLDLHERGYRMCECYSRFGPEGEFGHITEARLLAIPQADFREALGLLDADDLPGYEECVYNAAADAVRSRAALDYPGPAGSDQDNLGCCFQACCLDLA